MIVGFTGTRNGMTEEQEVAVWDFLVENNIDQAHHGDCIGADEEFHRLCKLRGGIQIVSHPPVDDKYRAYCEGAYIVLPPKPYIVRNHDIVQAVSTMIATPKESKQPASLRGQGTWSTIVYARRLGKTMHSFAPNGKRL